MSVRIKAWIQAGAEWQEHWAFLPPAKGSGHILRLIREILVAKPKRPHTDPSRALKVLVDSVNKVLHTAIEKERRRRFPVCCLIDENFVPSHRLQEPVGRYFGSVLTRQKG